MKFNFLKGAILTSLLIAACKEDDQVIISPSEVTIELASSELPEGSVDPLTFEIELDDPLPIASSLEFNASSNLVYGTDYYTVPEADEDGTIIVEIAAGETDVNLELYAKDNSSINGNQLIHIALTEIGLNLKLTEGTAHGYQITVIDDEDESIITVGFEDPEMTLPENAWPQFAHSQLIFSEELPNAVNITLKEITTLQWGYDYDSFHGPAFKTPTCTDGYNCEVIIQVSAGSKAVTGVESFVFDNDIIDGDRSVVFEIVQIDQGVLIDEEKRTFTFNITDDE